MIGLVPIVEVVWVVQSTLGLVSREAELHTDELEALRWWMRPHGFTIEMFAVGVMRGRLMFDAVMGVPGRLSALGGTKK